MGVAKDHGAPGEDVIDVVPTVHIDDLCALGLPDKQGGGADGLEGPDRAVHAAGDNFLSLFKEFLRYVHHR